MKQAAFSLADTLTLVGTLVFGFVFYLSMNFMTLGDTEVSLLWATVAALIIGGLAFVVKLLKRTSRNFKTFIIWERIILVIFLVVAFLFLSPFAHYFYVSSNKAQIQEKVLANINQAEGLFNQYEIYANHRMDMYRNKLNSIVQAKRVNPGEYDSFGFENGATEDNVQVENKVFSLKAHLFPSNYTEIKQADSTWLADAKSKIENWSPTGTVKVIMSVETEITSWKNTLTEYSQWRPQGETTSDFEIPLVFEDVSVMLKQSGKPNPMAIIIAIIIYAVMLLSYFVSYRSSKNHYTMFGKRKITKNKDIDVEWD